MTFNQFQKELRDLGIDGKDAYVFTMIYELLIEIENQLGMCARIVDSLANTMAKFVELNESQQRDIKLLMRAGRPDGVEVASVAPRPEDD
jgi:hypothetical protein